MHLKQSAHLEGFLAIIETRWPMVLK